MLATLPAANAATSMDWPVIGAALGTFITACWATWQGLKKGRAKVEGGASVTTAIVGGTIMDAAAMRDLTDALRHNTECTRENTRELQRHNDIVVMIGRPKD